MFARIIHWVCSNTLSRHHLFRREGWHAFLTLQKLLLTPFSVDTKIKFLCLFFSETLISFRTLLLLLFYEVCYILFFGTRKLAEKMVWHCLLGSILHIVVFLSKIDISPFFNIKLGHFGVNALFCCYTNTQALHQKSVNKDW